MLHLHQSELILEIMNQCCVWGQIKDTWSLVFQANVILIGFFFLQNVFKLNITCNVGIYIFSKWRLELCKVRCGLWTKKDGAGPLISQHSSLAAIHIEVVYIVSVCIFIHFATIITYSLFTSTEQLPFITALPHIALTSCLPCHGKFDCIDIKNDQFRTISMANF